MALLLTLILGLCFLIGIIITKKVKKKSELSLISIACAFMVMLGMIMFDIIPNIASVTKGFEHQWLTIIGYATLGFLLLKGLDLLIPHHHHEHKEKEKNKKEHNEHLYHIGFVMAISLMLHNCLEGISIYITGINDMKLGLTMALAVALHNIPLGMEIAIGMNTLETKKKSKILCLICLALSSFMGALILFLFQSSFSIILEAALLCMTFGMLLYISLFELFKEVWTYRRQKMIYVGLIVGLIINIILVKL